MTSTQTMTMPISSSSRASKAVITGRVLSGLAAAFMLFDLIGKLFTLRQTIEGTVGLG